VPLSDTDTDSPALAAAKKSRAHKNKTLIKIGAAVITVSAVLAGLTAFFLTRGGKESLAVQGRSRESLIMSDKIEHVEEVKSVAKSNDQFSKSFYDLLRKEEGNLIMSPFSVSGVMAMVSAGARGNTLDQIMSGLSFPAPGTLQLGYKDTKMTMDKIKHLIKADMQSISRVTGKQNLIKNLPKIRTSL